MHIRAVSRIGLLKAVSGQLSSAIHLCRPFTTGTILSLPQTTSRSQTSGPIATLAAGQDSSVVNKDIAGTNFLQTLGKAEPSRVTDLDKMQTGMKQDFRFRHRATAFCTKIVAEMQREGGFAGHYSLSPADQEVEDMKLANDRIQGADNVKLVYASFRPLPTGETYISNDISDMGPMLRWNPKDVKKDAKSPPLPTFGTVRLLMGVQFTHKTMLHYYEPGTQLGADGLYFRGALQNLGSCEVVQNKVIPDLALEERKAYYTMHTSDGPNGVKDWMLTQKINNTKGLKGITEANFGYHSQATSSAFGDVALAHRAGLDVVGWALSPAPCVSPQTVSSNPEVADRIINVYRDNDLVRGAGNGPTLLSSYFKCAQITRDAMKKPIPADTWVLEKPETAGQLTLPGSLSLKLPAYPGDLVTAHGLDAHLLQADAPMKLPAVDADAFVMQQALLPIL